MAEASNGIQQMALLMLNPQFAAQQQKFALQQQLAQQMIQEGAKQPATNQLANPGGQVVQNSPVAALARALQQGLGVYSANKNIQNQVDMYQNAADQQNHASTPLGSSTDAAISQEGRMGPATAQDVAQQYAQKLASGMGVSGTPDNSKMDALIYGDKYGAAEYEQAHKLQNMQDQARINLANETVNNAAGQPMPKANFLPPQQPQQSNQSMPPAMAALQQGMANQNGQPQPQQIPAPTAPVGAPPMQSAPLSPDKAAQVNSLHGPDAERPSAQPVNITRGSAFLGSNPTSSQVAGETAIATKGAENITAANKAAIDAGEGYQQVAKTIDSLDTLINNPDLPQAKYGVPAEKQAWMSQNFPQIDKQKAANAYNAFSTVNESQTINAIRDLASTGQIRMTRTLENIINRGYLVDPDASTTAKLSQAQAIRTELKNSAIGASNVSAKLSGQPGNIPYESPIPDQQAPSPPTETKTLNGVTYTKINGQWHQ